MHTLRTKLILLLVVSALTPLIIFGALSLYNFQNSLRNSIENSYWEISSRTTEEIRLFLNHSQELLQTLVQDLAETQLTSDQSERIIENYIIRFPRFLKIIQYDNRLKKSFSTSTNPVDEDVPDEPLLNQSLKTEYLFSSPYLSEDLTPVFWFLMPLRFQKQTSGIIAAQIDLMQMWRWVSETRLGQSGYVSVVDKEGYVIASGNPFYKRKMLSSEKPILLEEFDPHNVSDQPRTILVRGGSTLVTVKKISNQPGWFLVLAQPTSEAFRAIRTTSYGLLALILVSLFLMVITAIVGSQKLLLKPVRKLIRATEAIGQGNLTYRIEDLGRDELGQVGLSINRMSQDLIDWQEKSIRQERLAMFGRMASGLAHDLKHPVKNIENAAQLMESMHADEKFRQVFTSIVKREFSRINQFLDDLRNLTHEMHYNPELFSLENLMKEIMESFHLEAEKKQVEVILDASDDFPNVVGDPGLLRRLFENLVANALQAISEPGKKIWIRLAFLEDDYVRAQIQDNGPGIPPERLPGLFDEFTTTKRKGLGLGLAIVKKIMLLHGGSIEVESHLGTGTVFNCTWPVRYG